MENKHNDDRYISNDHVLVIFIVVFVNGELSDGLREVDLT